MSDVSKLQEWWDAGDLVRPDASQLNFIDLVRALAATVGVSTDGSPGCEAVRHHLGSPDHLVVVLVDGMGADQLGTLPEDAFLRRQCVEELQSVFLSTTGAALPSLASGLWPAQHGSPGWWARIDPPGVNAVSLPFQEQDTRKSLAEFDVTIEQVFPAKSLWSGDSITNVLPVQNVESRYSRYATGGTRRAGYKEIDEALALVRSSVRENGPGMTYVYLPQYDNVCHGWGVASAQAQELLVHLDALLARLAGDLSGTARLVITADHGQIDIAKRRVQVLKGNDPLRDHLVALPTGEPAVPIFHVRADHEDAFADQFRTRFGEWFALLTPDEVEALELLGPGCLSPVMRQRLGTFMGICRVPTKVYIKPAGSSAGHIGVHGGLTHQEMTIPLIVT
jgi:hypothetical protein